MQEPGCHRGSPRGDPATLGPDDRTSHRGSGRRPGSRTIGECSEAPFSDAAAAELARLRPRSRAYYGASRPMCPTGLVLRPVRSDLLSGDRLAMHGRQLEPGTEGRDGPSSPGQVTVPVTAFGEQERTTCTYTSSTVRIVCYDCGVCSRGRGVDRNHLAVGRVLATLMSGARPPRRRSADRRQIRPLSRS